MRIAHVTATFPPYYAGTGMVCYHNALELARRGHQVTVFTAKYEGKFRDPPEIEIIRLPALFRIGNAPFLPGLLGIKGFDILHLHYPFIFGAEMVWAVSRRRGIPYIVTHHNDLIGDGLRRYLFDAYFAFSSRLVYGGAAKIGAVSLDHAAACRASRVFRRRWKDVVEILNGVDVDLFRPGLDGEPIRKQCGVQENECVILFVGALDRAHHYRRVDLLIQAVHSLKDSRVHLLLVGDGDQMKLYRDLARNLQMDGHVHFLGKVPYSDLPWVYAAADLVVLPSQLQESFGMVLIEGMACGKPVIASNLPGVRSVVNDGEDGLLTRPGDAVDLAEKIQLLLDTPQLRKEMGKRGREKVEARYSWAMVGDRLESVYKSIMTGGL